MPLCFPPSTSMVAKILSIYLFVFYHDSANPFGFIVFLLSWSLDKCLLFLLFSIIVSRQVSAFGAGPRGLHLACAVTAAGAAPTTFALGAGARGTGVCVGIRPASLWIANQTARMRWRMRFLHPGTLSLRPTRRELRELQASTPTGMLLT